MTAIEEVKTILAAIQKINPEPMPRPGLDRQAICAAFEATGLAPPSELVELYAWHDGIHHLDPLIHLRDSGGLAIRCPRRQHRVRRGCLAAGLRTVSD
jgi:hypothetical protein